MLSDLPTNSKDVSASSLASSIWRKMESYDWSRHSSVDQSLWHRLFSSSCACKIMGQVIARMDVCKLHLLTGVKVQLHHSMSLVVSVSRQCFIKWLVYDDKVLLDYDVKILLGYDVRILLGYDVKFLLGYDVKILLGYDVKLLLGYDVKVLWSLVQLASLFFQKITAKPTFLCWHWGRSIPGGLSSVGFFTSQAGTTSTLTWSREFFWTQADSFSSLYHWHLTYWLEMRFRRNSCVYLELFARFQWDGQPLLVFVCQEVIVCCMICCK